MSRNSKQSHSSSNAHRGSGSGKQFANQKHGKSKKDSRRIPKKYASNAEHPIRRERCDICMILLPIHGNKIAVQFKEVSTLTGTALVTGLTISCKSRRASSVPPFALCKLDQEKFNIPEKYAQVQKREDRKENGKSIYVYTMKEISMMQAKDLKLQWLDMETVVENLTISVKEENGDERTYAIAELFQTCVKEIFNKYQLTQQQQKKIA